MKFVLKRLILGVLLIVAASAALLLSDLGRRSMKAHSLPRLGLLQHASTMLLDDGTRGTIDALAERGFVDGKSIVIEQFNAHGDIAVGNSIAAEMVAARYDLLVTMSTLSLQAVANANRGGKTVQVFGLVADPAVAGVGISWEDPLKHPANLVGYGSFLPVPDAFKVAREMFPALKRVGVAWNPAEANSRAFVEKAREYCQQVGIELLEANVENSNSVLESEVEVGKRARIPVFTITPGRPDRGTLFDYGADFYQIGRQTGTLAAEILRGADPKKIPIRNEVPTYFVVNTTALAGLRQGWRIPKSLLDRANTVVDEAGVHSSKPAGTK